MVGRALRELLSFGNRADDHWSGREKMATPRSERSVLLRVFPSGKRTQAVAFDCGHPFKSIRATSAFTDPAALNQNPPSKPRVCGPSPGRGGGPPRSAGRPHGSPRIAGIHTQCSRRSSGHGRPLPHPPMSGSGAGREPPGDGVDEAGRFAFVAGRFPLESSRHEADDIVGVRGEFNRLPVGIEVDDIRVI